MPLLFNPTCTIAATDCKYLWDLDKNNNLCLSKCGSSFCLISVKPGNDLYAIQSQSNGKYLALGSDNQAVTATLDSVDGALQIRAIPLDTISNDPFVWSIPASGDFLKVNDPGGTNKIFGNGTGADDPDCRFIINGATATRTE